MMFYLVLNIGIYTYAWKGLDYIKKKTIILVIVCRNTVVVFFPIALTFIGV